MKRLIVLLLLYVCPLIVNGQQRLTQAEYYVDTDPGAGLATPMVAYDGSFTDVVETIIKTNAGGWTVGFHKIGIRVKDNAGHWGPAFVTVINVQNPFVAPSIKISTAECFWDTDPGQGNGTAMLAFDGNFTDAMETVVKSGLANPGLGMHVLNVRVKDVNNHWGPVFRTVVSVQNLFVAPVIKLTTAECFWDTDPGQGNGTAMLAFDGNFTDAMESVVKAGFTAPGIGMHRLGVRVKDAGNHWSPVFSTVVSVQNPFVPPVIRITAAELFWDSDPGQGNGTAMLAFDGNFNDAYEKAAKSESAFFLSQGLHVLHVRVKDASNQWSPVFRTVVYLDSCITNPTVTAVAGGPTTFCPGDSVQLTASGGFNTYYWRRNGVPFGGNTQSVYVNQSGNYIVTALDVNGCPASSAVISVTVASPNAAITASGPLSFCQGDSVILDAGPGYSSYNWSNGATSQTITVNTSGTYTVLVTNSSGCSDTSAIVSTTVLALPTVPVITQHMDTLFSSSPVGNQWYLNGNLIPGATGSYYVTNTSGNYTVVVTGGNGCTAESAPYAYVFTGIAVTAGENIYALVYPNPLSENGVLLIHAKGMDGKAAVVLFDLTGRVLSDLQVVLTDGEVKIPLDRSGLAAGTYFYRVRLKDETEMTGKFIVQ